MGKRKSKKHHLKDDNDDEYKVKKFIVDRKENSGHIVAGNVAPDEPFGMQYIMQTFPEAPKPVYEFNTAGVLASLRETLYCIPEFSWQEMMGYFSEIDTDEYQVYVFMYKARQIKGIRKKTGEVVLLSHSILNTESLRVIDTFIGTGHLTHDSLMQIYNYAKEYYDEVWYLGKILKNGFKPSHSDLEGINVKLRRMYIKNTDIMNPISQHRYFMEICKHDNVLSCINKRLYEIIRMSEMRHISQNIKFTLRGW